MEYYSATENETMPFVATVMDLETIILSEVSQKEKDKYHVTSLICGIQNMTQMNLLLKQKQKHRHRKQICVCQKWWGEMDWEAWDQQIFKLLYI